MSEYISRQAIGKAVHDIGKEIDCEPLAAAALARVMSAVSCIPDADVTPVVHGHWKREYREQNLYPYRYICSICGDYVDTGIQQKQCDLKFCFTCGAKMDEESEV